MAKTLQEEIDHFLARTQPGPKGCRVWTGGSDRYGYGKLLFRRRIFRAHQVAWIVAHGRLPDHPLCVLHRCDNRLCTNPDHLFVGDRAANNLDCFKKGRRARGQWCGRTTITDEQALDIKTRPYYRGLNRDLSREFNLRSSIVSRIRSGNSWKYVGVHS